MSTLIEEIIPTAAGIANSYSVFEASVDYFTECRKYRIAKKQEYNNKWTYIMFDGDDKFKIGISESPLSRLKALKCGLPNIRLLLLHVDNMERELHERYKDKSVGGEWFELDEEDLNDLVCDDGFRYAPNIFHDGFENDKLYCVQRSELHKAHQSKHYFERHPEYFEFMEIVKQTGCITHAIKQANELGLRTPSGFAWKIGFARYVVKLHEMYLKGEIQ